MTNKERVLKALEDSILKAKEVKAEGIAVLLVSADGGAHFAEFNLDFDCVEAFNVFSHAAPGKIQ